MEKYQGDWQHVIEEHIRVRSAIFSEKDQIGIGTFQPKDEKSQGEDLREFFNPKRVKGKHIAPHTPRDRCHVGSFDAPRRTQKV